MASPPRTRKPLKHPVIILVLGVVGALVGLNILTSVPGAVAYVAGSNALAHMNTQIIKAGGVAISGRELRHGGLWWWQNYCIDVPCPSFKQEFLVPIEPGKEAAFMDDDLLGSQGYGPTSSSQLPTKCQMDKPGVLCLDSGAKPFSKLYMTLDPVAKPSDRAPKGDVFPKVWRTLTIETNP